MLNKQGVQQAAKDKMYHLMYANGIMSDGSAGFKDAKKSISDERYATLMECLTKSAKAINLHVDCCGIKVNE